MPGQKPLTLLHLPDAQTANRGGSGTYAVSRVGARRIDELEQELAVARAELEALRGERDELAAQLALARAAPVSTLPAGVVVAPPASHSSVAVVDVEESEGGQGPASLSGLVVQLAQDGDADERRRLPRLGCELDVEFLGDSHLMTGLSQDISEGGVFIATYQSLPIGSQITLGLELPSGRIEVQAEVRWARAELLECEQRPGFGVAFTNLSPEALAALTAFCRSEPPRYYEF